VTVDLEWTEAEPPSPPIADFDIVIETSALSTGGLLVLRGAEDPPSLAERHGVSVPPGWLRLRVCARGRGIAYDEAVTVPVEHYLLQVWPAPPSPTVNRTTGERIERHDPPPNPPSGVHVTPEPSQVFSYGSRKVSNGD
jgi:hypothetical protein